MKKKPLIEVTKSHEKMEQPPRKKYNLSAGVHTMIPHYIQLPPHTTTGVKLLVRLFLSTTERLTINLGNLFSCRFH